MHPLFEWLW